MSGETIVVISDAVAPTVTTITIPVSGVLNVYNSSGTLVAQFTADGDLLIKGNMGAL